MKRPARKTYAGKRPPEKPDRFKIFQIRLIASIGIFLTVLSARLIFPDFTLSVREKVLDVLNADVDYNAAAEVFADGITGKRDLKNTAISVFSYLTTSQKVDESSDIPVENMSVTDKEYTIEPTDNIPVEDDKLAEMVAVFKEDQSKYESYGIPKNVTYDAPQLGIECIMPAEGVLTSSFGYRNHPNDGDVRFHYGIDIGCDIGTEIKCFGDGVVTEVTDSSSYGLNIVVSHENGIVTRYAHCSEILKNVGDKVKCGEVIAKSGQTGNATGPCMHFEIRMNDTYVNPGYYLNEL